MNTIDITPTWGDIGNIVIRMALSQEVRVIQGMKQDIARAFAAAEALKAITQSLTHEQRTTVNLTAAKELQKQGY